MHWTQNRNHWCHSSTGTRDQAWRSCSVSSSKLFPRSVLNLLRVSLNNLGLQKGSHVLVWYHLSHRHISSTSIYEYYPSVQSPEMGMFLLMTKPHVDVLDNNIGVKITAFPTQLVIRGLHVI